METFERKIFTGERALFGARDLTLTDCIFEDGESPLKESAGLTLRGCSFRWKYPRGHLVHRKHLSYRHGD